VREEAGVAALRDDLDALTSRLGREIRTIELFKAENSTAVAALQKQIKAVGDRYGDSERKTNELKVSLEQAIAAFVAQKTDPIKKFMMENSTEMQRKIASNSNETNVQLEKIRSEIKNLRQSLSEPEPFRPPIRPRK
jgi:phage-related tail protein